MRPRFLQHRSYCLQWGGMSRTGPEYRQPKWRGCDFVMRTTTNKILVLVLRTDFHRIGLKPRGSNHLARPVNVRFAASWKRACIPWHICISSVSRYPSLSQWRTYLVRVRVYAILRDQAAIIGHQKARICEEGATRAGEKLQLQGGKQINAISYARTGG